MSKKIKLMQLEALRQEMAGIKDYVILEPVKVDAATDYQFRKNLREKQIQVRLVKNTLARIVLSENGIELNGTWSGPTLVCWGGQNIKALSNAVDTEVKAAKKDAKSPDKFNVKTAVADGEAVTMAAAKTMPTREEAIGEIVSALVSAGSELVSAITAPGAELASILKT